MRCVAVSLLLMCLVAEPSESVFRLQAISTSPAETITTSGTAFCVDLSAEGLVGKRWLLTSAHTLKGRETFRVKTKGGWIRAVPVYIDEQTDVAVLKVYRDLKPLKLVKRRSLVVLGNGENKGVKRKVTYCHTLRLSSPVALGSSGGPLLDGKGRVEGIVLRNTRDKGSTYRAEALHADALRGVAKDAAKSRGTASKVAADDAVEKVGEDTEDAEDKEFERRE